MPNTIPSAVNVDLNPNGPSPDAIGNLQLQIDNQRGVIIGLQQEAADYRADLATINSILRDFEGFEGFDEFVEAVNERCRRIRFETPVRDFNVTFAVDGVFSARATEEDTYAADLCGLIDSALDRVSGLHVSCVDVVDVEAA